MAVWIYAYGRNGLLNESKSQKDYLAILNSIPLDEVKALEFVLDIRKNSYVSADDWYEKDKSQTIAFYAANTDIYEATYKAAKAPEGLSIEQFIKYLADLVLANRAEEDLLHETAFNEYKSGTKKSRWELANEDTFNNRLIEIGEYGPSIRLYLRNDLIRITGPFEIFSSYGTFQQGIPTTTREYYHSYFKELFKAFKSDLILYAHEWSGLADDSDDYDFDYAKLKEQSNWEVNSSTSIHNMDRFYYEKL